MLILPCGGLVLPKCPFARLKISLLLCLSPGARACIATNVNHCGSKARSPRWFAILLIHHHVRLTSQSCLSCSKCRLPASHSCSPKQDLRSSRPSKGCHQPLTCRTCPRINPFQHLPAQLIKHKWLLTLLLVMAAQIGTTNPQYVNLLERSKHSQHRLLGSCC